MAGRWRSTTRRRRCPAGSAGDDDVLARSGSAFPVGSTLVACSARDGAGHRGDLRIRGAGDRRSSAGT